MQSVVAPASAEVGGNGCFFILRAMLTPERSVERMQYKINDQGIGSCVGVLQCFAESGLRGNLLVAQCERDGFPIRGFAMLLFVKASVVRFVQAIAPVTDEAVRQNASVVAAMAIIVGAGEGGEDRLQWFRSERCDRFSQPGKVGDAKHADQAIAP